MNRHIDKAMQLRNETPMVSNCAQTIMRAYADELGMTEQQKKNSRQPRWLNRLRRPSKKQRPERRSKEGTLR